MIIIKIKNILIEKSGKADLVGYDRSSPWSPVSDPNQVAASGQLTLNIFCDLAIGDSNLPCTQWSKLPINLFQRKDADNGYGPYQILWNGILFGLCVLFIATIGYFIIVMTGLPHQKMIWTPGYHSPKCLPHTSMIYLFISKFSIPPPFREPTFYTICFQCLLITTLEVIISLRSAFWSTKFLHL